MEYLAEKYQINAIHSLLQSHYCVTGKGGLGLIGERRRSRIQLAATRNSLSNHPEVNDLVEPTNLRSLEQAINIKR